MWFTTKDKYHCLWEVSFRQKLKVSSETSDREWLQGGSVLLGLYRLQKGNRVLFIWKKRRFKVTCLTSVCACYTFSYGLPPGRSIRPQSCIRLSSGSFFIITLELPSSLLRRRGLLQILSPLIRDSGTVRRWMYLHLWAYNGSPGSFPMPPTWIPGRGFSTLRLAFSHLLLLHVSPPKLKALSCKQMNLTN